MNPRCDADWEVGAQILDEYLVERKIGEGSFGAVHLLRNERTGERFAVKRSGILGAEARKGFLAELQSWMDMPPHPNIVGCRFFRTVGDRIAIFADYVDGGSLRNWISAGKLLEDPADMRLWRICDIALTAAWGLEAAHLRGLVHQDVKPENILLTADGTAKLTDLGLASQKAASADVEVVLDCLVQDLRNSAPIDMAKSLLRNILAEPGVGTKQTPGSGGFTLEYASPERLRGEPITSKTDTWSWGVCLLEMFSGKATWPSGDLAHEVLGDVAEIGPAVAGVPPMPPGVRDVLATCFADVDQRWPSIAVASRALIAAYQEATGRTYDRSKPESFAVTDQVHDRGLGTGVQWSEPRGWIDFVYREAGLEPSDAQNHWPSREGSRKTQVVADLRCLDYVERILAELVENGRRDLTHNLGNLYGEMALIQSSMGDVEGALAKYRQCLDRFRALATVAARRSIVIALNSMSIMLRDAGRAEEALVSINEAATVAEGLSAETGEDEDRKLLALAYGTKGRTVTKLQESIALLTVAVEIFESISDEVGLAKALASQAALMTRKGQLAEAEAAAAKSETMIRRLIEEEKQLDLRHVLAKALLNRAIFTEQSFEPEASLSLITESSDIYRELVNAGHWELRGELGIASFHRGLVEEAMSKPYNALKSYALAREALTEAVNREGVSTYAAELAGAYHNEATLRRNLGEVPAAMELGTEAVDLWTRLNTHDEGRWEWQLADARAALGATMALSDVDKGLELLEEAVAVFRRGGGGRDLASALMEMGIAYRHKGDAQRSAACYSKSLVAIGNETRIDARDLEALICRNFSNLLGDLGQQQQALKYLDRAIAIWRNYEQQFGAERVEVDIVLAEKAQSNRFSTLGAWEKAIELSQRAGQALEWLVNGSRPDLSLDLAKLVLARGIQQFKLARLDEARATLQQGARIYARPMSREEPETPYVRAFIERRIAEIDKLKSMRRNDVGRWTERAQSLIEQAENLGKTMQMDLACELYDYAAVILRRVYEVSPDPEVLRELADLGMRQGISGMYVGRSVAAENGFRTAVSLFGQLVAALGAHGNLGEWARAMVGLAAFLAQDGRHDEALGVADELKQRLRREGSADDQQWCTAVDESIQQIQDLGEG